MEGPFVTQLWRSSSPGMLCWGLVSFLAREHFASALSATEANKENRAKGLERSPRWTTTDTGWLPSCCRHGLLLLLLLLAEELLLSALETDCPRAVRVCARGACSAGWRRFQRRGKPTACSLAESIHKTLYTVTTSPGWDMDPFLFYNTLIKDLLILKNKINK